TERDLIRAGAEAGRLIAGGRQLERSRPRSNARATRIRTRRFPHEGEHAAGCPLPGDAFETGADVSRGAMESEVPHREAIHGLEAVRERARRHVPPARVREADASIREPASACGAR